MKFEDYLVLQQTHDMQHLHDLEFEVRNLKSVLEGEQTINKVLCSAINGTISPCLPSLLPPHIQGLLAELAMVEEEITWLERKVEELKLSLYQERKKKWKLQKKQRGIPRQLPPLFRLVNEPGFPEDSYQISKLQHCQNPNMRKPKMKFRRDSVTSAKDIPHVFSMDSTRKIQVSPSKDSSL